MRVTEAELLEELRAALGQAEEAPEGALTGPELYAALGVSEKTARPAIRALIAAGKMEVVRIPIVNIAGVRTSTWAYRMTGQ